MSFNVLVAYPYMQKKMIQTIKDNQHSLRFLLDSGAFTAWKAGKPIALDDYCRFIENLPVTPWRYMMLDVIGDPSATMKNYETMLARGFKPIPIFTRGEDPSVLDDYYKTSDVVAIGGLVGTQANKGFVKGIMEKVGVRKVHWLGFVANNFLRFYKPFSCDSSNVCGATMFGQVNFYSNGRMFPVTRKEFLTGKARMYRNYIEKIDLSYDKFLNRENWINHSRGDEPSIILNHYSFAKYSQEVEKKLGTYYFMSISNTYNIIALNSIKEFL